jgi:hypothetical protein
MDKPEWYAGSYSSGQKREENDFPVGSLKNEEIRDDAVNDTKV